MFINILVGLISKAHDVPKRFTVVAILVVQGDGFAGIRKLRQDWVVSRCCELAIKLFVDKPCAPGGDVDDFSDHIRIHSLHEVIQVDIKVIDTGAHFCGKVIAQVLGIEVIQVGSGIDKGAA